MFLTAIHDRILTQVKLGTFGLPCSKSNMTINHSQIKSSLDKMVCFQNKMSDPLGSIRSTTASVCLEATIFSLTKQAYCLARTMCVATFQCHSFLESHTAYRSLQVAHHVVWHWEYSLELDLVWECRWGHRTVLYLHQGHGTQWPIYIP